MSCWTIKYEKNIAILSFNNPPKNFIDAEAVEGLEAAMSTVAQDDTVKAVVIKSDIPGVFISGADVNIFRNANKEKISRFVSQSRIIFKKMENLHKPVIAAVEGICLGGGCEFILCCDIRIAGEGSSFGQPEIIYGLIPGGGGIQRLSRLLNKGRALKLLLTGFSLKAKEAYEYGLVDEIVQNGGAFDAALKTAKRIAMHSPLAVKYTKELVNEGLKMDFEKAYEMDEIYFNKMLESEDSKEGLKAFSEKRVPNYTGQ